MKILHFGRTMYTQRLRHLPHNTGWLDRAFSHSVLLLSLSAILTTAAPAKSVAASDGASLDLYLDTHAVINDIFRL